VHVEVFMGGLLNGKRELLKTMVKTVELFRSFSLFLSLSPFLNLDSFRRIKKS
jgi:hypothetical protein